ncbi:MAG: PPC domain-containing DNA-binding protein [Dehalococcoidia bacterium]
MAVVEYTLRRQFMIRVQHGSDLVQFLVDTAKNKELNTANFMAIGALKDARLGYYDQTSQEYEEWNVESPHEIVNCTGNISLKEGEPFVHAHVVLADRDGSTKGGHLFEGTVFAAEVHLWELAGPMLERKYDGVTGLSLWEVTDVS